MSYAPCRAGHFDRIYMRYGSVIIIFALLAAAQSAFSQNSPAPSEAPVPQPTGTPIPRFDNANQLAVDFKSAFRPGKGELLDRSWNCKEYRWYSVFEQTDSLHELKIRFNMPEWDLRKEIISQSDDAPPEMPRWKWDATERTYKIAQSSLIVREAEVLIVGNSSVEYHSEFRITKDGRLIGELTDTHFSSGHSHMGPHQKPDHPAKFFLVCSAD